MELTELGSQFSLSRQFNDSGNVIVFNLEARPLIDQNVRIWIPLNEAEVAA